MANHPYNQHREQQVAHRRVNTILKGSPAGSAKHAEGSAFSKVTSKTAASSHDDIAGKKSAPGRFARGGKVKSKGKGNTNIAIMLPGGGAGAPKPPMPPVGAAPPMPPGPPMPPHPMGGAMGGPPPGMPPGPPPGMPMRASGGRIKKAEGGALTGVGRLDKAADVRKGRK